MRFLNGSHLFAVLRDMNLTCIPMLVPEEQKADFEQEFGFSCVSRTWGSMVFGHQQC